MDNFNSAHLSHQALTASESLTGERLLGEDEEHLIADNDGSGTYHFTIGSGNNYIILEGGGKFFWKP